MSAGADRTGTEAIAAAFARARGEGRAAIIPFVTAGDPSVEDTLSVLEALVRAGADLIELGVPFSDPVADGPAIQQSSQRALASGFRTPMVFEVVAELRRRGHGVPVVLFTYVNPILSVGIEAFAERAAQAGADAVLAVDLPVEEGGPLRVALAGHGLALVPLVAPTTAPGRLAALAQAASGFIYIVSMLGVTGQRLQDTRPVADQVSAIRRHTSLPVAVGFGVRGAEDVCRLAGLADGVVVGSELVRRIHAAGAEGAAQAAEAFVGELCGAARQRA